MKLGMNWRMCLFGMLFLMVIVWFFVICYFLRCWVFGVGGLWVNLLGILFCCCCFYSGGGCLFIRFFRFGGMVCCMKWCVICLVLVVFWFGIGCWWLGVVVLWCLWWNCRMLILWWFVVFGVVCISCWFGCC